MRDKKEIKVLSEEENITKEKLRIKANASIVVLKSYMSGSNNGNALVNLILNLSKYEVERNYNGSA